MVWLLWATAWAVPQLKIELPHHPTISLLHIHPREMKTFVHTKTWTQMSAATALFKVTQISGRMDTRMWYSHSEVFFRRKQE